MRKATRIAGIVLLAVCMFLMTLAYAQTVDATGSQSGRLVANRAFVIDFGQYESRMKAQIERNKKLIESRTNASAARGLPTEKFTMEASDWALDKWEVELNSSASSIMNNVLSYVVKVGSPWWLNNAKRIYSGMAGKLEGYNETPASNVLGVRIHFPTHRQNCWAKIHPPFEINAYDDKGGLANTNNGIVDNVGQIKSISVWVKGRNYDNGFAIRLKDGKGSSASIIWDHSSLTTGASLPGSTPTTSRTRRTGFCSACRSIRAAGPTSSSRPLWCTARWILWEATSFSISVTSRWPTTKQFRMTLTKTISRTRIFGASSPRHVRKRRNVSS